MTTLLLVLAWDLSGLDLPMAHWFGGAGGFPLQQHWFWEGLLHERVRQLQWLPALTLIGTIFLPFGALRDLPRLRRLQLAVGTLLALLVITLIKWRSATSCPWDLAEFGGALPYVSHWAWTLTDKGGGRCFPAGHASAAFAYCSGFAVFSRVRPDVARRWLAVSLAAGLTLGLAQQVRGAHFMSHTLWTAWLCWTAAVSTDWLFTRLASRKPPRAEAPAHGHEIPRPLTPAS